jgi:hypothetical protein
MEFLAVAAEGCTPCAIAADATTKNVVRKIKKFFTID